MILLRDFFRLHKMNITARNQKLAGIAIAPILFIVAILAVLAGAIAAGSGSFNSGTSQDRARLMAQAILQKANEIKSAVEIVVANGCTPEQISFQNDSLGINYTNPNSPLSTQPQCHVFHPHGGKLQNWPGSRSWQVSRDVVTAVQPTWGGHYDNAPGVDFIGLNAVQNPSLGPYGTTAADLFLRFPYLEQATCAEINRLLTGNPAITNGTGNFSSLFRGTYTQPAEATITLAAGDRGCAQTSSLYFYIVAIAFR